MENFYSYETFLNRIRYAVAEKDRRVVFVLGSPVSSPRNGNPGVANVDGVVEIIREYFESDSNSLALLSDELANASINAYQAGVNFLLGNRGQDAVNDLIRKAVIGARLDAKEIMSQIKPGTDLNELAEKLEAEVERWHIPQCLKSLASLIKERSHNFDLQLTTNFDPLLSLAIKNQGAQCFRSVLSKDGSLNQAQGDGCHIVHLHGYWRGDVDTLHTPRQLTQLRPKLKASLANLLKNNLVVPIAYSGWDDVFTQTLLDLARDDANKLEVLWTYFGKNDADLMSQNKKQLDSFKDGLSGGRLLLYKNVDCHKVFDDLLDLLRVTSCSPCFQEKAAGQDDDYLLGKSDEISVRQSELTTTDTIPQVSELFGRSEEIAKLSDFERNKIIAISGIGGQGKSSLAALYALDSKRDRKYSFVDWRDCREYDNTFFSVLIRAIHHISAAVDKQIPIASLREASIETLCSAFVSIVKNHSGIVIFDNVDQYVDLENGEPLHELKTLIDFLIREPTLAQIIFTSRPRMDIQAEFAVSFTLRGLNSDATENLFCKKYGKEIDHSDLRELYKFTEGHPLWISLIASKCRHEDKKVAAIIADISSGKGDLPERTILSTWNSLNDKQKIVLRMLAELERPLTEDEFTQIDFELNFNQITKALRTLKSLSLVEVREGSTGSSVIDLHPLIRQYVRKNFPRTERQKFIAQIILVIDRKISAVDKLVKGFIPSSLVDLRLHKAILSLNQGDFGSAITTLDGLYFALMENGMAEEFVRQAVKIFDQIDWLIYCSQSKQFNEFWSRAIAVMVVLDKLHLADKYIAIYEKSINGKGAQYINLCDARCYRYWYCDDFEQAIYYGQQGAALQGQTGVDTDYSCSHNLALAWRDNGEYEKALEFFLGQAVESEVLAPGVFDKHRTGNFYGNIGRCYFLMGNLENASICYKKSAILLERDRDEVSNRGYIRHWIGELLFQKGQLEDSAIFFRAALHVWHNLSPRRFESITARLNDIVENNDELLQVLDMPGWRLENRFMQWINY